MVDKKWSSSFIFIIACVGSAVGLGNIWKFPYIAHENGGGAFVLVYLFSILLVGFPIIVAEMMIGRVSRKNVYDTFKDLSNNNLFWKFGGALFLITAFLILSFYTVVAGWTLQYFWDSLSGNLLTISAEQADIRFGNFLKHGPKQILFHTLFTCFTGFIIYKGTSGIEKAVKFLMPTLALFVVVIASVSINKYGFYDTYSFLFHADFSKLTGNAILEALGHAFFTLSVGMGAMLIYGSYINKADNLMLSGFWITLLDTLIALMACFMIYPIIFGTGMNLTESSSMLFTALVVQLMTLPGGQFVGALFYLLVGFAALSSTISLLEPVVSFAMEKFNFNRHKATLYSTMIIWIFGVFAALSNGASSFFTKLNIFGTFDYLTSNWTLPIGGLIICIFTAWVVSDSIKKGQLQRNKKDFLYLLWHFMIKYISPVLVVVVIISKAWVWIGA